MEHTLPLTAATRPHRIMTRSLAPWRKERMLPRPFERLFEEIEYMMGRFWDGGNGGFLPATVESFYPTANLAETEGQFEVTLDLPGMKPDEIKVEMHQGNLLISGERKEEKEEKGKTYHRVERSYGEFRRTIALPAAVDEGKIDAKFCDGVLRVTLPKSEKVKPKQITVKS
jgi:HSP20 family protein